MSTPLRACLTAVHLRDKHNVAFAGPVGVKDGLLSPPTHHRDTCTLRNILLGSGAYGAVYVAEKQGPQYAVKEPTNVITSPCGIPEEDLLSHPDLATAIDVAEISPSRRALVFELATGGDLYFLFESAGPLPGFEVRSIARQLAQGLAFLHRQNTAHRGECVKLTGSHQR